MDQTLFDQTLHKVISDIDELFVKGTTENFINAAEFNGATALSAQRLAQIAVAIKSTKDATNENHE